MFRMFWGLFWRVASCWEATAGIVFTLRIFEKS
jgi:hypothetical protein